MLITSFIILAVYIIASIFYFGIPASISDTAYLWAEKLPWNKKSTISMIFSIVLAGVVAIILPTWLNMTENTITQFLPFLSCASLFFVAAAPKFKDTKIEHIVHLVNAILFVLTGLIWIIIDGINHLVIFIPCIIIPLAGTIFAMIKTKSIKSSIMFWGEVLVIVILYLYLICKFYCL